MKNIPPIVFRRSGVTIVVESGIPKEHLKVICGWKSDGTINEYIERSEINLTQVTNGILKGQMKWKIQKA